MKLPVDDLVGAFSTGVALAVVEDGEIIAVNDAWRRLDRANASAGNGRRTSLARAVNGSGPSGLLRRYAGPGGVRFLKLHAPRRGLAAHALLIVEKHGQEHRRRRRGLATAEPGELELVRDDERRKISRELHDLTAQNLSAAVLDLARAEELLGEETHARPLIAEAARMCMKSLEEIRTLSYELYPPLLEEGGLVPALRWYAGAFSERTGIEVALKLPRSGKRLPIAVETALFRIAQESLLNVKRHARSKTATVRLSYRRSTVRLEVADRGHGLKPRARRAGGALVPGAGIQGMRDRMRALDGLLEFTSDRHGTSVRATVPGTGGRHGADPARG